MNNKTALKLSVPKEQKYLGNKGLILFLACLSAFPPLSTDLYLPALPTMSDYFGVHDSLINLTLVLFFVFYSAGTLFWGPMSDKYGRKPVLIIGLTGYALASLLCGISSDVYQLIIFRALQALSGSAATAVATAIVKDVYQGKQRETTLAIVQSIVVIAPVVAPVIGAMMLQFTSWRGIFVILGAIGFTILFASFFYQETIEEKNNQGVFRTIGRLGVVLKNSRFRSMLIIFAAMAMAFMSFIAGSSYIYQNTFGVSEQVFSYYFAFNALGMMVGPLLYIKLSNRFNRFSVMNACFLIITISGLLVVSLGWYHPLIFALVLFPATTANGCLRPPATNIILDQVDGDTGSASSLMIAFHTIMGSVGVMMVSIDTSLSLQIVGVLNAVCGLACGLAWLYFSHKPFLAKLKNM